MNGGRKAPKDTKKMCHWHCCQSAQTDETYLCAEHQMIARKFSLPHLTKD